MISAAAEASRSLRRFFRRRPFAALSSSAPSSSTGDVSKARADADDERGEEAPTLTQLEFIPQKEREHLIKLHFEQPELYTPERLAAGSGAPLPNVRGMLTLAYIERALIEHSQLAAPPYKYSLDWRTVGYIQHGDDRDKIAPAGGAQKKGDKSRDAPQNVSKREGESGGDESAAAGGEAAADAEGAEGGERKKRPKLRRRPLRTVMNGAYAFRLPATIPLAANTWKRLPEPAPMLSAKSERLRQQAADGWRGNGAAAGESDDRERYALYDELAGVSMEKAAARVIEQSAKAEAPSPRTFGSVKDFAARVVQTIFEEEGFLRKPRRPAKPTYLFLDMEDKSDTSERRTWAWEQSTGRRREATDGERYSLLNQHGFLGRRPRHF